MNHQHFFSLSIDFAKALPEGYNMALVLISYLVATLAGFCASSVSQYISVYPNSKRIISLKLFGGCTLGLGIWSMHFIGMLAFSLPIEVKYDVGITLLSILPAIIGSTITIFLLHSHRLTELETVTTALILAAGIASMHFIGMTAMNLNATMVHDPYIFGFSILVSWVLAIVTLLALQNKLSLGTWLHNPMTRTLFASITFGFSVATMHYLAMLSAYFFPTHQEQELPGMAIDFVTIGVIFGAVVLVGALSIILAFKRRIYVLDSLALTQQIYVADTIDNMIDPYVLCDSKGKVLLINHSFYLNFDMLALNLEHDIYVDKVLSYCIQNLVKFESTEEKVEFYKTIEKKQPCKFKSIDDQVWLLRQTITNSNNLILTWTNLTEQTKQQEELIKTKDQALETMQTLQETQEELAETKQLAATAKLVANVAHELNTPLGVVITSLSGIHSKIDGVEQLVKSGQLTKSSLHTSLQTISDYEDLANRNAQRAAKIVKQFKYISVNEYQEPKQFVNIGTMFNRLFTVLGAEAKEQQIVLKVNVADNIKNGQLSTFEDSLSLVIKTLCFNALEHAFSKKEQGKISIEVFEQNNMLMIEVTDNGTGIDAEVEKEIFEPFVSSKRFEGNIGLGLHIAYNLVHFKLKGTIELTKSDQSGTQFVIQLPISAK